MKVLLSSPPAYINDPNRHFIQAGSRWSFATKMPKNSGSEHYHPYPFFLGYSSALLKRDVPKVETKALDACALDFDELDFLSYVKNYSPDLLLVEIPTISFSLMMDVLREVKESTGCTIAVSGPHSTALTNEVMEENEFIDYCLLGEYEITLKELVNALTSNKGEIARIDGLAYRSGSGIVGRKRKPLMDVDYLPFPDRDDLPIERYHNFEIVGKPCIQMWSSRGCPFNCAFCVHRQIMYASPLYRKRNPKKVVDEMEMCKEKYGAKQIYFDDDTIAPNRENLTAICDEIIGREIDLPWTCMGDMNLNFDTLKFMKKAGCVGIAFGIETINPETLKKIGKAWVGTQKAKQLVENCRKLGIFTHATYMVGLPTDTKEGVLETLNFAIELDTDGIQVSIATPFPGTPFYDMCEKNGWLLTKEWVMYNGAERAVVNYPHFSREEIEELYKMFRTSWKRGWAKRVFRWYSRHPRIMLRYFENCGVLHSIKRGVKVVKSLASGKS